MHHIPLQSKLQGSSSVHREMRERKRRKKIELYIFEFVHLERYNVFNISPFPRSFETALSCHGGTERVGAFSLFVLFFYRANRLLFVPISRRDPYLSVIQTSVGQPIARWYPERENWCLIRVYQATRFINIVFTKPVIFFFFF